MGKAGKFGPEDSRRTPEGAGGDALQTAEASENAARRARSDVAAPAPLAGLGAGLRSAAPQAPGPSNPKRRSSADPGNRAEASASDASGSAAAGAPPPAPPESAGAAAPATLGKLGHFASASPAGLAREARHAKASNDQTRAPAVCRQPSLGEKPIPGSSRRQLI